MRESRLGFGCQPVFSAIIRVSRNVPVDPAPFRSPGRCAQTHISNGGCCTCSNNNNTKHNHTADVLTKSEAETRPDCVIKRGGINVDGSYRTPVTWIVLP